MISLLRKLRQKLISKSKTSQYLLYAIGEIFLVMLGILLALAINNWNEDRKGHLDEIYVLNEVLKNLKEDNEIIVSIIKSRSKTGSSVEKLKTYINTVEKEDSLKYFLGDFLNFDRYYPINHAYEVLKSKGLKLSNDHLITRISRYYDYEQNKVNSAVKDVEHSILRIFNTPTGLFRFIEEIEVGKFVTIIDPMDQQFLAELNIELVGFRNNNIGTLNKLIVFKQINEELIEAIELELQQLPK
jgi:hypothetical protein